MPRRTEQRDARDDDRERSPYRDDDDVRNPLPPAQRAGTKPDSKSEARGRARENVGRTARKTASRPTGPKGNNKTQRRVRS